MMLNPIIGAEQASRTLSPKTIDLNIDDHYFVTKL